jgi:hypothetical protein
MSNSLSTLLLRNLIDVFGENDPVRRRAAIDEIFHEDAVFYDPKGGIFRGRNEIDRIAGVIKATHPDFEYRPLFPPEELGDAGRVRWVKFSGLQPRLETMLFMTGVQKVVQVYRDEAEALAAFGGPRKQSDDVLSVVEGAAAARSELGARPGKPLDREGKRRPRGGTPPNPDGYARRPPGL